MLSIFSLLILCRRVERLDASRTLSISCTSSVFFINAWRPLSSLHRYSFYYLLFIFVKFRVSVAVTPHPVWRQSIARASVTQKGKSAVKRLG